MYVWHWLLHPPYNAALQNRSLTTGSHESIVMDWTCNGVHLHISSYHVRWQHICFYWSKVLLQGDVCVSLITLQSSHEMASLWHRIPYEYNSLMISTMKRFLMQLEVWLRAVPLDKHDRRPYENVRLDWTDYFMYCHIMSYIKLYVFISGTLGRGSTHKTTLHGGDALNIWTCMNHRRWHHTLSDTCGFQTWTYGRWGVRCGGMTGYGGRCRTPHLP